MVVNPAQMWINHFKMPLKLQQSDSKLDQNCTQLNSHCVHARVHA